LLPLYLFPYQVSGLPQHLDRFGLAGAAEFQHVLHFPDIRQGATHLLRGAWLLLLSALLLAALRHGFPFRSASETL